MITEGRFSEGASSTDTWTWGKTTKYRNDYTATFVVRVSPYTSVRIKSVVNQGVLNVPYTMDLSSKSIGVKVETKGTWRGVSSWDLRHTITTLYPDT